VLSQQRMTCIAEHAVPFFDEGMNDDRSPDQASPGDRIVAPMTAWESVRWWMLLVTMAGLVVVVLRECGSWLATVNTMPK
jgi:hypothetical protein